MARKFIWLFLGALIVALTVLPAHSKTEVNVNIGIVAPPAYVVPAPPPVVVIPRTYVYYVPDIEVDILFYQGYWYRPYEGHWYRGRGYNGPWAYLAPAKVPQVLVQLPPYYRSVPPGHQRIPYGQFKKDWQKWGRDKHWNKDKDWQEGRWGEPGKKGHEEPGRAYQGGGHGGPKDKEGHGSPKEKEGHEGSKGKGGQGGGKGK
jgi:hypothetical protein